MLRKRMLMLAGGCLLTASGLWADQLGFVDCASHSEDTQVFGKARRSQDVLASIPCGERFTILLNGFIFSRIETRDGKIGYIYSSLISIDSSGTTTLQPASERVAVPRVRETLPPTAKPSTAGPKTQIPAAAVQPAAPQPAATPAPEVKAAALESAPVEPVAAAAPSSPPSAPNAPQTTSAVPQPSAAAAIQPQPATPEVAPATPATAISSAANSSPAPATPSPASAPVDAPSPVVTAAAPAPADQPASTATETTAPAAPAAQPSPAAPGQPQPAAVEPAQPAAPPIRNASVRTSWEKPNPTARRAPLLELYGGYSFTRIGASGGGSASNMNGAIGSFGWNIKPWLQIAGDTSYNFVSVGSTKTVLYGNHYGPRFFLRARNRWSLTPFAEALVGGSRADTTLSGVGGFSASDNCISYKVGGGVDIHPSRHLEIRLVDGGYYRTAFGTNLHQNNYFASTGIVIRLFGRGAE